MIFGLLPNRSSRCNVCKKAPSQQIFKVQCLQKGPSWGPDGRWLRTEAEARRRPVNGGGEMHRSELATSEPTQILRLPTGRMKRPAYLNMTMPPTKVTQSPAPHAVANARRWTNLAAASAEAQRVGREEEPRG